MGHLLVPLPVLAKDLCSYLSSVARVQGASQAQQSFPERAPQTSAAPAREWALVKGDKNTSPFGWTNATNVQTTTFSTIGCLSSPYAHNDKVKKKTFLKT